MIKDTKQGETEKIEAEPFSVIWKKLEGDFRIVQTDGLPAELTPPYFWAVTATGERSLLCRAEEAPAGGKMSETYCGIYALGQLDFSLVGILHGVTDALKAAGISLLAQSTFDTDYVFWNAQFAAEGYAALEAAGVKVI